MGKDVNVILATILVFVVVVDVSLALNFRILVDSPPKQLNNNSSDYLNSSPNLSGKQSSPVGKEKQNETPPTSTAGEDNSKDKQVTKDMNVSPPPGDVKENNDNSASKGEVKEKEKDSEGKGEEKEEEKAKAQNKEEQEEEAEDKEEQKEEEKERSEEEEQKEKQNGESKTDVAVGDPGESCDAMETKCKDSKSMTACIKKIIDHDSKALVLLIQNKGLSNLKVNVTSLSSENKQKMLNIPKLQSKQVTLPLADARINKITLTAGNGFCVLHLGAPVSQGNMFQWMPSYSKFMNPVYGAYLILAITFIAGGVWACCWFSKRKGHCEVLYQELEMSRPETAVAVETAEGWDEVWDDDWDDENAVRSPNGSSKSANGTTSLNPKKYDWEDWEV